MLSDADRKKAADFYAACMDGSQIAGFDPLFDPPQRLFSAGAVESGSRESGAHSAQVV